ncbi:MAG TPA: ribosome maturation factor RimM [Dehalococcoidia bacterium]|nr:ribosome maturation factor RimM [Dehalococcoidia bacterium]
MTPEAPEFDPETAVTVGRIVAPHGVHGEVRVEVSSDFPKRFEKGATLWLEGAPVRVVRSRVQGKALLLTLEGVSDRAAAERLRGRALQAPRLQDLGEDTYYRDDLIGLKAVTPAGETLGVVQDIFSTGSNDVFVVKSERGELLLPATDDVVREVDITGGRMVVEVIEGLEWTRPPASQARRAPRTRRRRA